jgi:hypothetical protein
VASFLTDFGPDFGQPAQELLATAPKEVAEDLQATSETSGGHQKSVGKSWKIIHN